MTEKDYFPDGDIEVRRGLIEDEEFIVIRLDCPGEDPPAITITFRPEHFVAFADNMQSLADRIVANRAGRPI